MLGAIAGDVIGSPYEHAPIKTKDFPLFSRYSTFTDDTVLSLAIADSLLHAIPYTTTLRDYFQRYPNAGYGGSFRRWARSPLPQAYGSYGNGSAMRVSPIAWFYDDYDRIQQEALRSAEVTHNHPEGIKGAQAVAAAICLARTGAGKRAIRTDVEERFGYDLAATLDEIRPDYTFQVSCQASVPQAIIAFLESTDFEDAIRNAVSLGGDSDTQACIAGAIAEAHYGGVPAAIAEQVLARLDERLRGVYRVFSERLKR
ncbi:MAG: ADP-ribosylglycohydrolase family protein [Desulfuromonadales bacterium]|nr:ADP-ribosylglycohydrolase family protein [Desulfuromonadales bacterium]